MISSIVRRFGIRGLRGRGAKPGPGNAKPAGVLCAQAPAGWSHDTRPRGRTIDRVLGRDPVSELFDAGARAQLGRAYADRGTWKETRLQPPEARHRAYLVSLGIDPDGPDDASIPGRPGLDARTRWARGYVRALYYQHVNYSTEAGGWRAARRPAPRPGRLIEVRVGGNVRALGLIPAGQLIAVRMRSAAEAAQLARKAHQAASVPESRRSDSRLRDWG